MSDKDLVFIILPAYNEEQTLGEIIRKIKTGGYSNIIVVDDGSWDSTYREAKSRGVLVLKHEINLGSGAATRTGLDAAKLLGAMVAVTMDADGQHDPSEIDKLIQPIRKGRADVVFGSRFLQKNKVPWEKRAFNRIANVFTWFLSGLYLSDTQTGLRAFNRKAIELIDIRMSSFEFCSEIVCEVSRNRLRLAEVPISVRYDIPQKLDPVRSGYSLAQGIKTVVRFLVRSLSL